MIVTKVCPDCYARWEEFSTSIDRENLKVLTICCPQCHEARQAKIKAIEEMYPSSEDLGLVGSTTDIPTARYFRPHAAGRRIMRKEERQG